MRVTATSDWCASSAALDTALDVLDDAFARAQPSEQAALVVTLRFARSEPRIPAGDKFEIGEGIGRVNGIRLVDGAIALVRERACAIIGFATTTTIDAEVAAPPSRRAIHLALFTAILVAARALALVPVHAALVETPSGGWLLVGPSGAGKSTTTLALAETGLIPRADDIVFVREQDLAVFPLGRPFHLSPRALDAFPAWKGAKTTERLSSLGKYDVRVVEPSNEPVRVSALLLLSPPGERTNVGTSTRLDALAHVVAESAVVVIDTVRAPTHLDTLRRLVESGPIRTLRPGPDALSDPGRLRTMIEASLRDGES